MGSRLLLRFILRRAAPALRSLSAFADYVGKTHRSLQRYTPLDASLARSISMQ